MPRCRCTTFESDSVHKSTDMPDTRRTADADPGEPYPLRRFAADLRDDIEAYLEYASHYGSFKRTVWKRLSALLTPSVTACALYRVSRWFHARSWRRLAYATARLNLLLTRVSICPASRIGGGLYIPHPATSIVFQGAAGRNLCMFAGSGVSASGMHPLHGAALFGAPEIGDDVSLGSKSLVQGPVRIGAGVKIGINACITRDIPAGAVVIAKRRRSRVDALPQPPAGTRGSGASPVAMVSGTTSARAE